MWQQMCETMHNQNMLLEEEKKNGRNNLETETCWNSVAFGYLVMIAINEWIQWEKLELTAKGKFIFFSAGWSNDECFFVTW